MIELNNKKPLYIQIYEYFVYEIQKGNIKKGARLPSKRQLAESLGVSISTVENAYQQLLSEGFIFSRAKSGFFVEENIPLVPMSFDEKHEKRASEDESYDVFSLSRSQKSLFPYKTLLRKYRLALEDKELLLQKCEAFGDRDLRKLIAKFIYESKGISCSFEQIVIASGTEDLLGKLVLFLNDFKYIYIENPGYPNIYQLAQRLDKKIIPVEIDEEGLKTRQLKERALCFVTPRHQFPLAVSLSKERRKKLISWADRTKSYIIEDDYDSEFKYKSKPLPSLFSMSNKVIYISGLTKTISPSLRFAYMVLPKALLGAYKNMFGQSSCPVSSLDQRMLSLLIADGSYSRHIRRAAKENALKLELILKELKGYFPNLRLRGFERGLHFVIPCALNKEQVVKEAGTLGIKLNFSSDFFHSSGDKSQIEHKIVKKMYNCGKDVEEYAEGDAKSGDSVGKEGCFFEGCGNFCEILIGFACLERGEIEEKIKILAKILKNAKKK